MFCVKNCIKGSATNYIVNNTKGIFLLDCVALLVYVIVRKHNFFRKNMHIKLTQVILQLISLHNQIIMFHHIVAFAQHFVALAIIVIKII